MYEHSFGIAVGNYPGGVWWNYGSIYPQLLQLSRRYTVASKEHCCIAVNSMRAQASTPQKKRAEQSSCSLNPVQIKLQRAKVEQRDILKRKRREEQEQNVARKKQVAEELAAEKAERRRVRAERAAAQGDADESESSEEDEEADAESGGKVGDDGFAQGKAMSSKGTGGEPSNGNGDAMQESEEEGDWSPSN